MLNRFTQVATAVGALVLCTVSITAAVGSVRPADLNAPKIAMIQLDGPRANG